MLVIISSILILIAIVVIFIIIARKFPALAILDVNNIAGAKEARFKEELIKQRLERDLSRWLSFSARIWMRVNKKILDLIKSTQKELKKKKQIYQASREISLTKKQEKIKKLFLDIENLFKTDSLEDAEDKLIEIIGLDDHNLKAFFKLGELYTGLKKWLEAGQTYQYALKLAKQYRSDKEIMGDISIQQIYFSLAINELENNNLDLAIENIAEALDLEPNNPRYLDLILDISIMRKDKKSAQEYFNKLAKVNPENNKLAELYEKIENL